jgi:hypothetical protein
MMSSTAKAHARHVTAAKTSDVTSAETADVTAAEATDVTSAEAAHVSSAKAAHVASAASVSSATATATAGLRIRSKKAAGKCCTCQNHHHSSSHDILLRERAAFPPQGLVRCRQVPERRTLTSRWAAGEDGCLSFLLNSRSIIRAEYPAPLEPKGKRAAGRRLD